MKKVTLGLLAHVDAGKTTLSEGFLFHAHEIRKQGRVDSQDTLLDYDDQERKRGITIYAKEASFDWKDTHFTLIDTPGHVDFSTEMERSLSVLDAAVVIISGLDGVQSHTETILKLLDIYHIPAYFFVNKMDNAHFSEEELMEQLVKVCPGCVDFNKDDYLEKAAECSDELLDKFFEGEVTNEDLQQAIKQRRLFPCYFGSALKNVGINQLLDGLNTYLPEVTYPEEFGLRVFKISRDVKGERLSHVKITGGKLKAKDILENGDKVDQIRVYSGTTFTMLQEAEAGTVCALKGPTALQALQGLGFEENASLNTNSCMSGCLILPKGVDSFAFYRQLKVLEEEDPTLHLQYNNEKKEIFVHIMGEIQTQVLLQEIENRFKVKAQLGDAAITYKETIAYPVEGVGHYEPLRHYAEVHLLLEPLPRGKGLVIDSDCPVDVLPLGWQKQVLSSLDEAYLTGTLTNSELTDMKITLIAGKGHIKHTEGGDFRQAALRALRHGLMFTKVCLLEPYVKFTLELENDLVSRALFDLEQKKAKVEVSTIDDHALIKGLCPYRTCQNYAQEVIGYTHGKGKWNAIVEGYYPCEDEETIVQEIGYDPLSDVYHSPDSVFCSHGAGVLVPYYEVEEYMHLPFMMYEEKETTPTTVHMRHKVSQDELQEVMNRTYKPKEKTVVEKKEVKAPVKIKVAPPKPPYMIVDGYNLIHSYDGLKELAEVDLGHARDVLINQLADYQYRYQGKMMVVFDAYKVKEGTGSHTKAGNLEVVYTRAKQTADSYIEQVVSKLKKDYEITVVSSDGWIQNIILGLGAARMSAREFEQVMRGIRG